MPQNDRRSAHRYAPARDNIRLGWWEGQLFQTISARLRNLSLSGALVEIELGLTSSAGTIVWLCLVDRTDAHWVQAEVVEVCPPAPETRAQLRLKFIDPVPYETFRAAVWDHGAAMEEPALPGPPPPPSSCGEQETPGAGKAFAFTGTTRIRLFRHLEV